MAFDSFGAFLAMGGHGPYVWACYAVFFLLMGAMTWWSLHQRQVAIAQQRRRMAPDASADERPAAASFTRIESSQD
jgi:heme exporter protein D